MSEASRSFLRSRRGARLGVLGLATAATVMFTTASVSVQTPMVPPQKTGDVVRVGAEEARRIAREVREGSAITTAPGLEVSVWATGHLVADALALDVDRNGVVYVGATPRGSQWLDTRQHPDWVPELHRLKTTEDLRQFFRQKMATELSEQNTWITDFNNDGVRDYRDVMVVEEKIYKIEDTDNDGIADKSTLVFSGFNEDLAADILGGIMVHESGDIYATIAPDLWRLRDTNGDGTLDFKESISHGYSIHPSFSGHDMSALTQGPDGMIYWKIGEIGMNVVDKTGKRWPHPHTGAVLRSNPDGSDFEVFAYGVRNPQEIAFDEFGNLVSVDNDGDYPGENERVIYIAEGSDTGWRSTWQFGKYTDANNNRYNPWMDEGMSKVHFPEQPAYITPPIAPYYSGPSGFAYNPGTALDARWKNHFFVTSFTGNATNARILGFTLKPKGAGFELGENTEMVRGVLAPGMKIGPDGAIYLTDWIRGWGPTGEGRLWKLDSPEGAKSPARAEVKTLIAASFSDRPVQGLVDLLKHEDMRVRMKAQFELVRRGDNAPLTTAANAAGHQLSRIHAIWGLGQLLRTGGVQASAIAPLLKDADPEIRAQAAKVLGHARATAAAGELIPLVRDANPRVRYFATTALGRMAHRPAFDAIVAMLAADAETDVYLRNAGFVALQRIGDRAAIAGLASHQSRGVRLAAVVALRRLQDAGVARFLEDRDALVVAEAAGAVNDEGGIVAALPALARTLERTDLTPESVLRRALNANLRVGDAAGVKRVADFAARQGIPEELRIEAIAILGVWGQPSNLDRVDGSWLGPQAGQRAADAAQAAVVALAGVLSAPASTPAVKIAWLEAASKIGAKSQAAAILARLRTDSDATVRVAALRALQSLEVPEVAQGVQSALADADATVRMAAISAMPSMPLDNAAKVQNLSGVLAKGTPGEQQSALGALGRIKAPESAEALGRLAAGITNGAVAPAIQLDLLEAMREHGAEPLQTRLDQLKVGRDLSTLGTALPGALATGGSLMRGRQVIQQNQSAQCARCHTIGNSKSDVGPDLNKIGSQLSREQLVQSLLDPSARLAPGFGQVSVTTRGGQKYEGVLRAESATEIVVEDATRGTQKIAVADIAARENGVSAMPPMGLLLSPREIRDVVEALANQK